MPGKGAWRRGGRKSVPSTRPHTPPKLEGADKEKSFLGGVKAALSGKKRCGDTRTTEPTNHRGVHQKSDFPVGLFDGSWLSCQLP